MPDREDLTQLLSDANHGNEVAYNKVFPMVYEELRKIAHRIRFKFYGLDTLNTTAIVHEAYIKLVRAEADWNNRHHFYGVAAKAMRQILLNAARKRKTLKRGDDQPVISLSELEECISLSDHASEELINLDEALNKLEKHDKRQVKIVECRFFAGMSIEETATVLDISPATVKRSWQVTKAWLFSQIQHQNIA